MHVYLYIYGFIQALICLNSALDKMFSTELHALAQIEVLHNDRNSTVFM